MEHILDVEDKPDAKVLRKVSHKGAGDYTLCERCNMTTGSRYGTPYAWWAHQGMRWRMAGPTSLALPFWLFPGSVSKQIMSIFASSCGPGLCEKNPELRKFILDPDAIGIPAKLRLYCFIVDRETEQSRTTGIVVIFDSKPLTIAEFAFPPFGYVLTFDCEPPDRDLRDITFFTHHRHKEYREIHLPLPTKSIASYLPADYRSPAEWKATGSKILPRKTE